MAAVSAAGPADRPTLVLLHALPLDASSWDQVARALRAQGHPVLAHDQLGFGSAPPTDGLPPSLDTAADELAAELDRRGLRSVVLAGCSMGGYLAMAFLRRHPGRVAALALLAARATADDPAAAARRRRFAELVLDDRARDLLVAETTPALLGATTRVRRPELVERVTELALAARPASVAWAQRAIADRADALDTLRATDVPAVVLVGDEDELVTLDEAGQAVAALPRGRLVILPGVGHLAPLEAPEAVVDTLGHLLTRQAHAEATP
ncbi:alpha/beta hydrolase [Streptomyces sp. DSM 44915]|uniref:Alpha/beta hydrolase n=1 Tax=Streptomyces chisholmiae TaxID=3075540 RepID=A0ABU2JW69_9ACTN|nr:alpha/beta hydrolase [Streptomyces sp. DSM 44915]MDT0269247.1 alpha/beta hydrolase [Streptomyces sp. DSM 44915]